MKNPWLAKNAFLSMWLSTANSMLGTARGQAMAEARRQQRSMMNEGARAMMSFWSVGTPPLRAKSGSRRRK